MDLDESIKAIPKRLLGAGTNGHTGQKSDNVGDCDCNHGYKIRNKEIKKSKFAVAHDLTMVKHALRKET